jgi:hypothetical protein
VDQEHQISISNCLVNNISFVKPPQVSSESNSPTKSKSPLDNSHRKDEKNHVWKSIQSLVKHHQLDLRANFSLSHQVIRVG